MRLTVGLWMGVWVGWAITCPQVTCSDSESHICAQYTPGQVQLSVCPDSYWCDLDLLYSSYFAKEPVLICTREDEVDIKPGYLRILMEEVCLQRNNNDNRRLAQGNHPHRCETNQDCMLEDGSQVECVCGLGASGSSYCELAPKDPQVQALYSAACEGTGDQFLKEFLSTRHFVHLQEALPCRALVFADLAVYEFLQAGGSVTDFIQRHSAAFLTLTLSSLLVA